MNSNLIFCLALVLSSGLSDFANLGHCADETTTNDSSRPELLMNFGQTGANGMTANKTVKLETTNMQDMANAVTTNYQNFILSVTNAIQTNFIPAAATLATCLQTNAMQVLTNSAILEVGSAGNFGPD